MQFILEGYEGVCSVSTVDSNSALICISSMPGFECTVSEILGQLRLEFNFHELS